MLEISAVRRVSCPSSDNNEVTVNDENVSRRINISCLKHRIKSHAKTLHGSVGGVVGVIPWGLFSKTDIANMQYIRKKHMHLH